MPTNSSPLEADEGKALHQWLELSHLKHFHIGNESQSGTKYGMIRGAKLKAQGQMRGIPDYCILLPNGLYLWVELKRQKGGHVSDEQIEWLTALSRMENTIAIVARGWQSAMMAVCTYNRDPRHSLMIPAEPIDCRMDKDGNLQMKILEPVENEKKSAKSVDF